MRAIMETPDALFELAVTENCGKLAWTDEDVRKLKAFLRRTGAGARVEVYLREKRHARTMPQNRYYWGVLLAAIAGETGHPSEDLHEIFKAKFLPRSYALFNGKEHQFVKSTTELSKQEFTAYLHQVRAFAESELGVLVPDLER